MEEGKKTETKKTEKELTPAQKEVMEEANRIFFLEPEPSNQRTITQRILKFTIRWYPTFTETTLVLHPESPLDR